jgi:2-oxoglutarate dehydrogenase E2 component (dihydrolipoamide succinyltransferase)
MRPPGARIAEALPVVTPAARGYSSDVPTTREELGHTETLMPTNVDVPPLGESVSEAVLLRWLKNDGDPVGVAEPIAELETDKANVDLPSPAAGVFRPTKSPGATVRVGETVARIDEGGASPAAASAAVPASAAARGASAAPAAAAAPAAPQATAKPVAAKPEDLSPAVRRMVEENHLDPAQINPSGPNGRLTKEDVQAHLDSQGAKSRDAGGQAAPRIEAPAAPPSSPPAVSTAANQQQHASGAGLAFDAAGVKREPMSKIRKRIAQNLVQAQQTAAILTTFNEVDLSNVMALRSKYKDRFQEVHGVSLGLMSFFARAVVLAIKEFPRVNAQLDGDDVVYFNYVHLGIAVSTDRGLAVPVLRNVEQMSFAKIEAEIKRLANATREGKLGLQELSGGTFTITNGGVFGSLLSTPIINPPQSAILGMHTIQKRPVAVGDKVEVRPMMYLALSYDHRLIDGRESVSFLVRVKEFLEDPARLMLEI